MQRLRLNPDLIASRQRVELDGVVLQFRVRWRARMGAWYIDTLDATGDPIVVGRRLSPGSSPWAGVVDDRLPPGILTVIGRDPYRRNDLGGDVVVVYVSASEIPEDDDLPAYRIS